MLCIPIFLAKPAWDHVSSSARYRGKAGITASPCPTTAGASRDLAGTMPQRDGSTLLIFIPVSNAINNSFEVCLQGSLVLRCCSQMRGCSMQYGVYYRSLRPGRAEQSGRLVTVYWQYTLYAESTLLFGTCCVQSCSPADTIQSRAKPRSLYQISHTWYSDSHHHIALSPIASQHCYTSTLNASPHTHQAHLPSPTSPASQKHSSPYPLLLSLEHSTEYRSTV
jgi:hypothetical protein